MFEVRTEECKDVRRKGGPREFWTAVTAREEAKSWLEYWRIGVFEEEDEKQCGWLELGDRRWGLGEKCSCVSCLQKKPLKSFKWGSDMIKYVIKKNTQLPWREWTRNGKNEREEATLGLFQNFRPWSVVSWIWVTAVEIEMNRWRNI